jgi:hypothetical protein
MNLNFVKIKELWTKLTLTDQQQIGLHSDGGHL